MKFFEAVEHLLDTYNSIDIRVVAFLHDNVWKAAYLIVRFRLENELELKKEHDELLKKIGTINENDFCVRLFSFPIDQWNQIKEQWEKKFICFEDKFAVNFEINSDLNAEVVSPNNNYYDHVFHGWNSYNLDEHSLKDIDVSSKIRSKNKIAQLLHFKNIESYLSVALSIEEQKIQSLEGFTLVLVPVLFKLDEPILDNNLIDLSGKGVIDKKITIIIDFFKNRNGSNPYIWKDRVKVNYTIKGQSGISSFQTNESIPDLSLDDAFKVSVYGKNGLLLQDGYYLTVRNRWNTKSVLTNPIYPIFKQFVTLEEFKTMLFNSTSKNGKTNSDNFEKGISWLCSILGLNSIWLGKDFESSGSNEERIVLDLLGHNNSNHILLLNVTTGIPIPSDFAREKRYRENLQNKINNPNLIMTSIMFSNGSVTNLIEAAKLEGLILIGKDELEYLLQLIEKGDNDIAREYLAREKIVF